MTVLLLAGVGVLIGLLIDAHATGTRTVAVERAEDELQAEDLGTAEWMLTLAENRATEAEAVADGAVAYAEEAEAAQDEAELAAAATDEDLDEFLRLVRGSNYAFLAVPDASLVELGEVTCDYLDTFGNSDPTLARVVGVGVASGMSSRQAAEVTSAAVVVLCPQHKLE
ncbi:hypothetical protein A7K94_0202885 [Modestobacter sp. VKM Ac-2676]|nr:hypothetical protein A7K94_0202885 [Modestobacter sp. VKM Ac-2676]